MQTKILLHSFAFLIFGSELQGVPNLSEQKCARTV